jgi:serine/threonine protein kinase
MALAPGTKLGPYEVVALAGAGGMGEVYRARDARLNREVAIKVQRFVQWSDDGKSVYVSDDSLPASVYKVDLSSGEKTAVLRLAPPDPSGVDNIAKIVLSRDGRAYAYNYRRYLGELPVVEGLK